MRNDYKEMESYHKDTQNDYKEIQLDHSNTEWR